MPGLERYGSGMEIRRIPQREQHGGVMALIFIPHTLGA